MNHKRQLAWATATVLALAALIPLLAHLWADQLPERMAIHWGPGGAPDGFAPPWVVGLVGLAMVCLTSLLLLGFGAVSRAVGDVAPFAVGTAVMLSGLHLGMLWDQRGLDDPARASIGFWLVAALLAGLAAGALWWWAWRRRGPRPRASGQLPADALVADVPDGARIAWTGITPVSSALLALVLLPAGLLALWGLWTVLAGELWLGVFLLIMAVPLGVTASSMRSRVTVDSRGVEVRGLFRWAHVPLGQVEHAHTRHIQPLADFGGYGLRRAFDGSQGFVTAAGEALVVERAGEGPLVVTVGDPDQAAAALNTLVARAA